MAVPLAYAITSGDKNYLITFDNIMAVEEGFEPSVHYCTLS